MTTRRPARRTAIVAGAAGLAVAGAVGIGAAAFADGTSAAMPAPSASASASPGTEGAHGTRTHAPHIGGSVLAVSGSTVTVKDRDGFTRTIRLASDVKVTKDDATSSVSAITKGTWIEATGTVASDTTSLDATAVRIGMPTHPGGGRGGFGGGPRGERPSGSGEAPTPSTTS